MPDYQKAIEELKAAPDLKEAVNLAWNNGLHLFQFMSPTGDSGWVDCKKHYGCLTMIKSQPERFVAHTEEMTKRIQADPRIPTDVNDITPETLEVFKEYQEEADRTFRQPKK